MEKSEFLIKMEEETFSGSFETIILGDQGSGGDIADDSFEDDFSNEEYQISESSKRKSQRSTKSTPAASTSKRQSKTVTDVSSSTSSKEGLIQKLQKQIESLEKENSDLKMQNEMLKEESFQQRFTIYKYRKSEFHKIEEEDNKKNLTFCDTEDGDRTYTNFDVELTQAQQADLSLIPTNSKFDSKYIFRLLDWIFGKKELANASITGLACKNPNYASKPSKKLDETRLKFIHEMFKARVYSPDPDEEMTAPQRLKRFNMLVNTKIQNTRALTKRRLQKKKIQS